MTKEDKEPMTKEDKEPMTKDSISILVPRPLILPELRM